MMFEQKSKKPNIISLVLLATSYINRNHILYLTAIVIPFLDRNNNYFQNSVKRYFFFLIISLQLILMITDYLLGQKKDIIKSDFKIIFILIYLLFLGSCFYAFDPVIAFNTFIYINFGILLAIILINISDTKNIEKFYYLILFSAAIISAIAFYQYLTEVTFYRNLYPRINSIFWDPNIFGLYILTIFSLVLPRIWLQKSRTYLIIGLITIILIFLSLSRTAFVSIMLVFTYFLLINRKYKLFTIAAIATSILGFIAFLIMQNVRFAEASNQSEGLYSIIYRLDIIRGGVNIFKDHWLFGVGLDNFKTVFNKYVELDMFITTNQYSIHSWPIQILAEQGIIGFISVIFMLIYIHIKVMNLIPKINKMNMLCLFEGYYLAFCSFWIFGLAYHSFFRMEYFWLIFGLFLLTYKHSKFSLLSNKNTYY